MQLLESLANDHPRHAYYQSALANAQLSFGERLAHSGRSGDGEVFYREACAAFEKLVADFPENAAYVRDLEDCRRRTTTVLKERRPSINTSTVSTPTK